MAVQAEVLINAKLEFLGTGEMSGGDIVNSKNDGTYTIQFTVHKSGKYLVHVTVASAQQVPMEIHGSPFSVTLLPGSY